MQQITKKMTINLIIILMALNIFSCNPRGKNDDLNIEWQPGINAPKYYPCRTVFGSFSAGESVCSISTGGCQYDGWGESGLEMSTGHFVPNKLTIGWFSFAEDKFFKGEFQLPADTIQALFKQGFVDKDGDYFGYNTLIVNVYPKGGVALWMAVGGCRTVEIGHFQGEEMDYDWKSMYPDMTETREEDNKLTLEEAKGSTEYIAQHGITQEPFKSIYRQRYNYTIAIDSVQHANTLFMMAHFYNGEMDKMEGDGLGNNFFKKKAVPKYVSFTWVKDGVVYYGKVYFDEEEMFKVFADISNACPNEPYVLYLKPNFNTRKLTVSLRSNTKEIEIQKIGKIGKSDDQTF